MVAVVPLSLVLMAPFWVIAMLPPESEPLISVPPLVTSNPAWASVSVRLSLVLEPSSVRLPPWRTKIRSLPPCSCSVATPPPPMKYGSPAVPEEPVISAVPVTATKTSPLLGMMMVSLPTLLIEPAPPRVI